MIARLQSGITARPVKLALYSVVCQPVRATTGSVQAVTLGQVSHRMPGTDCAYFFVPSFSACL